MIFAALSEAADRGELLLVEGGLCRFRRRKDGFVVVHEILVLPGCRRAGVGRLLVGRLKQLFPGATLLAKCPTEYAANGFWAHLGFRLVGVDGRCNVWEYHN